MESLVSWEAERGRQSRRGAAQGFSPCSILNWSRHISGIARLGATRAPAPSELSAAMPSSGSRGQQGACLP